MIHRMENWQIEYLSAQCLWGLESRGLKVRIAHDRDEVLDLMSGLGKKPSSILDPDKHIFTKRNSLWMFATLNGKPVMGGGVRVDDIGDEDLGRFLQRSLHLTIGVRAIPNDVNVFEGRLTGRVAYFGDLVSASAYGLTARGKEAISLFTAYGHHRVFTDLEADCTYCFLRGRDRRRATDYGFLDTDPFTLETDELMYPDGNTEWVGHLHRSRLPALLHSKKSLFVKPLAEDQKLLLPCHSANTATNADEGKAYMERA